MNDQFQHLFKLVNSNKLKVLWVLLLFIHNKLFTNVLFLGSYVFFLWIPLGLNIFVRFNNWDASVPIKLPQVLCCNMLFTICEANYSIIVERDDDTINIDRAFDYSILAPRQLLF